jgi:mevalonate kinase
MPAFSATAPGKVILFGEHAVVYNRPAIAVPVSQVQARAFVQAAPAAPAGQVQIIAQDIRLNTTLDRLPKNHPLAIAIEGVAQTLNMAALPSLLLKVSSTIPIAAGLGSGTAVTVAVVRALAGFLGHPLKDEQVSAIAFRVDQRLHGTPSGIDNTVISYAQPIYFIRNQPFERLNACQPFHLVIGNTGAASPTRVVVNDVRERWEASPAEYERIFEEIGQVALQARQLLENGPIEQIGPLMNRNHALLQQLDVSSPDLDRLVQASLAAGALGAKLCGGGRGGNMLALVKPELSETVAEALNQAGAARTIATLVSVKRT